MLDVERARELSRLTSQGELQLKNAAFRQLKAIMMRLAKGEVAERLEIWRTAKQWALVQLAHQSKEVRQRAFSAAKSVQAAGEAQHAE